MTKANNEKALKLYELVKQLDAALHKGIPPGGNANLEKAQELCNELRRELGAE